MNHKLCVTFVCSLIHSSKQKALKYYFMFEDRLSYLLLTLVGMVLSINLHT